MLQEIITYLVVAAAFIFAGWKTYKKLRKKKNKKKPGFKSGEISMQHNCSDCAAECILRDAPTSYIKNNTEKCTTNYTHKS
jgi:hypothetical protein